VVVAKGTNCSTRRKSSRVKKFQEIEIVCQPDGRHLLRLSRHAWWKIGDQTGWLYQEAVRPPYCDACDRTYCGCADCACPHERCDRCKEHRTEPGPPALGNPPALEKQSKKWMQEVVEKMDTGSFSEWCGGQVTQACIDRAARQGGRRARQAALAVRFRPEKWRYPKQESR
jgi:hypothetical protein